jgi:hypothetical protein
LGPAPQNSAIWQQWDRENQEATSFKEEAEQALIKDCVELDPVKNIVWAKLPFIWLQIQRQTYFCLSEFSRHTAGVNSEKSQHEVKSHQKLVHRGHVAEESELPKAHLEASQGEGYFIPERINEGLLSMLFRMVFNASSKTPGRQA